MLNQNKKAFTLIELLVVIAIIGLISTLAAASFQTARKKSRDAKRKHDINQLKTALEFYFEDHEKYPDSIAPAGSRAHFPNANWSNSSDESWDYLQEKLKKYITLPIDPLNQYGGWARHGVYNYSYYSRQCNNEWYMIVYGLENQTDEESHGVTNCIGQTYNYRNTITTGVSAP